MGEYATYLSVPAHPNFNSIQVRFIFLFTNKFVTKKFLICLKNILDILQMQYIAWKE